MKCKTCGNEIQPRQAFCTNCGTKVDYEQMENGNENMSGQSIMSLKKKFVLLAGIFIDYFICCRLIGGWFGLILLVLTFIASPYLFESILNVPAKAIKEFMIHLGVFFVVVLFLFHGISKDRQYSKWEVEAYGRDTRSISERIHDILTREPELHSRYVSYEQEQSNDFIDIYGFDPTDEVDITTFSQDAIIPSFRDLRNNIADYKGTAIKVKGLIIGKYAPEDYMEGITEIGIDANEFNEILDTYYGYTCLNDNSEVAGGYVVITADPSAYPNEWKEIYGYPVGVNQAGDIIIWGEFFLDEENQMEGIGENVMETIPADTQAETWLDNSEYILPDSNLRYINREELIFLDKDMLRIARNEIYARHGRKFETADLNEYFSAQSWYNGYLSVEEFDDSIFNEYEKANLDLIKNIEEGTARANHLVSNGTYAEYQQIEGIGCIVVDGERYYSVDQLGQVSSDSKGYILGWISDVQPVLGKYQYEYTVWAEDRSAGTFLSDEELEQNNYVLVCGSVREYDDYTGRLAFNSEDFFILPGENLMGVQ